MRVVESELIVAVVADRHCHVAEVDNLDLVRMTAVPVVRVVTPMHGGQRRPNDRDQGSSVSHLPIGTPPRIA